MLLNCLFGRGHGSSVVTLYEVSHYIFFSLQDDDGANTSFGKKRSRPGLGRPKKLMNEVNEEAPEETLVNIVMCSFL